MPKESFEQFVKRQKEKLDKAEKMVEGIKERWKDKIEEVEMVEKSVKELKKLWEENEEKAKKKKYPNETFSFLLSLPLPEVPPFLLEKISNKFLKEFDWKKFKERVCFESDLGMFLSAFLRKNVESYISSQKQKGVKEENIKPIKVHLDVKKLPFSLDYLGYRNPQKLHLSVEGNLRVYTGSNMEGGKIIVKGDCKDHTGWQIKGGEIIVRGDCRDYTAERMKKGEITVEGDCGAYTAWGMKGGTLIVKGEVIFFSKSAFSPDNKGTIIWKNTKIWEDGNWTKEGKEMKEKGKIPIG